MAILLKLYNYSSYRCFYVYFFVLAMTYFSRDFVFIAFYRGFVPILF